jgi:hypothetical protein
MKTLLIVRKKKVNVMSIYDKSNPFHNKHPGRWITEKDNLNNKMPPIEELFEAVIEVGKEEILYKNEEGKCEINYNGKEREGAIITLSSKGKYKIGIFKEDPD